MDKQLREAALQYHRQTPAGKISVNAPKPMITQRDLALAYSPGVAAACELIVGNSAQSDFEYERISDGRREIILTGMARMPPLIMKLAMPVSPYPTFPRTRDNQRLGCGRMQLSRMASCFTQKGQTTRYASFTFNEENK